MLNVAPKNQRPVYSLATDSLCWNEWDGIYLVYQRASAETHVFNETTFLILKCLEQGASAIQEIKQWTEAALGLEQHVLDSEEFSFAAQRLEELGIIERMDDLATIR